VTQPPPIETKESLAFKLTLLESYMQRVEKRLDSKAVMFERGLLEYKKMQAAEKKRPKDEKDIVQRLRPFARLQSAEDYEAFAADILYEAVLRKRIQELQHYRRMGLTTAADIEKYETDTIKRTQAKATLTSRDYYSSERLQLRAGGRQSSGPDPRRASVASAGDSEGTKNQERESTPKLGSVGPSASGTGPPGRKPPAPLNLANSPSLHLLTAAEQTLCSQLRILPKPYLVIKETLVREYARRGGKLRRREARDLVKIDVNKTSRVWDFLVQAGFLRITAEPSSTAATTQENGFALFFFWA
jgi:transcriptional adapter 2-alpha